MVSKISLEYITSGKSYREVASDYNLSHLKDDGFKKKTPEAVKSDIAYSNKKLSRYFGRISSTRNALEIMFGIEPVNEYFFELSEEALRMIKTHYADNIFNNKSFLLNIPAFSYETRLSDKDFRKVKDLIKPYIINQRKIAQTQLNKMSAGAGYLRYIMQKDVKELNEVDIARRNELLELFNEAEQEQFKIDNSNRDREIKAVIKNKYIQNQEKLAIFDELTAAIEKHDSTQFKIIVRKINRNYIQNVN